MPIVDVELVLRPAEELPTDLAARLADRLGQAFDSEPNGTWVKVRGLPIEQYGENGGLEAGTLPVFVSILRADILGTEALQAEIGSVVAVIAEACQRAPDLVHVFYEPPARGRVAFGGQLVK